MFTQEGRKSLLPILSYTPPRLYTDKDWYVGFYAYDPSQNKMRRKKIKLNFIYKVTERRRYAMALIKRLHTHLENGWNPWIEADNSRAYHTLKDVFDQYRRTVTHWRLADFRKPNILLCKRWNKNQYCFIYSSNNFND